MVEPGDGNLGGASDWDAVLPAAVRGLADELVPVFYGDLKRLAHRERARVGAGATMQTTALVHETYLKLRAAKGWNDEAHFLRAAALAMRHALVNHAEERLAAKRGGGATHLPLTAALEVGAPGDADAELLALDEALGRLARQSVRLARVVECRFFAGLGERETARALDLSERTVRRDWTLARAWLYRELAGRDSAPSPFPSGPLSPRRGERDGVRGVPQGKPGAHRSNAERETP